MPQPLLGATDSFNSSTATIVPDRKSRPSQNNRFLPQGQNANTRALVGSDSLERHISSALRVNAGGDDGMIGILNTQTQDMGGNGLSGLSFMQEYIQISPEGSQQSNPPYEPSSNVQMINQFGHHQFQSNPSSSTNTNTNTFEPISSIHSSYEPIRSPSSSNAFSTLTSPVDPTSFPDFRPSSVNSHHSASSVDASEYYSTTDMDTDDDGLSSIHDAPPLAVNSNVGDLGMANMDLTGGPAQMTWTPYQPSLIPNEGVSPSDLTGQAVSPSKTDHPDTRSTRTRSGHQPVAGPSKPKSDGTRGLRAMTEEEKIKVDKLEHRRDINRRSAQKHRLQRKKEMETMTKILAEKDAQIHQLQRDLEVEKARNDQLRNLMNNRLARSGSSAGH
ncbi:uncharacterized protein IL334_000714 [Kwoniella shivajii]|uniref:BZIP domain-containing protein n=1 Tax=Kwoniella shivajii TaxID=564305 RepID=A0ABZ1CPW9_9TREE|nr:hypothetical protein IL334_000714 [Kwoniella shivajii]